MTQRVFYVYSDPGHAWVKVSTATAGSATTPDCVPSPIRDAKT